MKFRNLLNLAILLIAGQMLFSCNSAKYYEFAAHKPEAYNTTKAKPVPTADDKSPTLSQIALEAADEQAINKQTEPKLTASIESTNPAVAPIKAIKPAVVNTNAPTETSSVNEAEALQMAKERMASMTKSEKKAFKNDLKEMIKQDRRVSNTSIVEIILAVLIPPLAVFLHDGIGTSFWINIILTLLFIIPGIIHALLVVTDSI